MILFPPRILVDARESGLLRGYHCIAATTLMAERRVPARFYVITTGHPEEQIARDSFQFDTGRRLCPWEESRVDQGFDIYALFADSFPDDPVTATAIARSRIALVGLMFPDEASPPPSVVTVSGHDTDKFVETVACLLSFRRGRCRWVG